MSLKIRCFVEGVFSLDRQKIGIVLCGEGVNIFNGEGILEHRKDCQALDGGIKSIFCGEQTSHWDRMPSTISCDRAVNGGSHKEIRCLAIFYNADFGAQRTSNAIVTVCGRITVLVEKTYDFRRFLVLFKFSKRTAPVLIAPTYVQERQKRFRVQK